MLLTTMTRPTKLAKGCGRMPVAGNLATKQPAAGMRLRARYVFVQGVAHDCTRTSLWRRRRCGISSHNHRDDIIRRGGVRQPYLYGARERTSTLDNGHCGPDRLARRRSARAWLFVWLLVAREQQGHGMQSALLGRLVLPRARASLHLTLHGGRV